MTIVYQLDTDGNVGVPGAIMWQARRWYEERWGYWEYTDDTPRIAELLRTYRGRVEVRAS